MNNRAVLFALIVAAVMPVYAHSQSRTKPETSQLHVIVRADHESYQLSDTLRLETHLINTGDEDIYTGAGTCVGILHAVSLCT